MDILKLEQFCRSEHENNNLNHKFHVAIGLFSSAAVDGESRLLLWPTTTDEKEVVVSASPVTLARFPDGGTVSDIHWIAIAPKKREILLLVCKHNERDSRTTGSPTDSNSISPRTSPQPHELTSTAPIHNHNPTISSLSSVCAWPSTFGSQSSVSSSALVVYLLKGVPDQLVLTTRIPFRQFSIEQCLTPILLDYGGWSGTVTGAAGEGCATVKGTGPIAVGGIQYNYQHDLLAIIFHDRTLIYRLKYSMNPPTTTATTMISTQTTTGTATSSPSATTAGTGMGGQQLGARSSMSGSACVSTGSSVGGSGTARVGASGRFKDIVAWKHDDAIVGHVTSAIWMPVNDNMMLLATDTSRLIVYRFMTHEDHCKQVIDLAKEPIKCEVELGNADVIEMIFLPDVEGRALVAVISRVRPRIPTENLVNVATASISPCSSQLSFSSSSTLSRVPADNRESVIPATKSGGSSNNNICTNATNGVQLISDSQSSLRLWLLGPRRIPPKPKASGILAAARPRKKTATNAASLDSFMPLVLCDCLVVNCLAEPVQIVYHSLSGLLFVGGTVAPPNKDLAESQTLEPGTIAIRIYAITASSKLFSVPNYNCTNSQPLKTTSPSNTNLLNFMFPVVIPPTEKVVLAGMACSLPFLNSQFDKDYMKLFEDMPEYMTSTYGIGAMRLTPANDAHSRRSSVGARASTHSTLSSSSSSAPLMMAPQAPDLDGCKRFWMVSLMLLTLPSSVTSTDDRSSSGRTKTQTTCTSTRTWTSTSKKASCAAKLKCFVIPDWLLVIGRKGLVRASKLAQYAALNQPKATSTANVVSKTTSSDSKARRDASDSTKTSLHGNKQDGNPEKLPSKGKTPAQSGPSSAASSSCSLVSSSATIKASTSSTAVSASEVDGGDGTGPILIHLSRIGVAGLTRLTRQPQNDIKMCNSQKEILKMLAAFENDECEL